MKEGRSSHTRVHETLTKEERSYRTICKPRSFFNFLAVADQKKDLGMEHTKLRTIMATG